MLKYSFLHGAWELIFEFQLFYKSITILYYGNCLKRELYRCLQCSRRQCNLGTFLYNACVQLHMRVLSHSEGFAFLIALISNDTEKRKATSSVFKESCCLWEISGNSILVSFFFFFYSFFLHKSVYYWQVNFFQRITDGRSITRWQFKNWSLSKVYWILYAVIWKLPILNHNPLWYHVNYGFSTYRTK